MSGILIDKISCQFALHCMYWLEIIHFQLRFRFQTLSETCLDGVWVLGWPKFKNMKNHKFTRKKTAKRELKFIRTKNLLCVWEFRKKEFILWRKRPLKEQTYGSDVTSNRQWNLTGEPFIQSIKQIEKFGNFWVHGPPHKYVYLFEHTTFLCKFYQTQKKIAYVNVVTRSLISFRFHSDMFHLMACCHFI